MVNIYTTGFNIQQFYVLPTHCIYVFYVDLRTNSDYFPIQHQLTGFYNWDGVCLLRGTDWVFKYSSGQLSSLKWIIPYQRQDTRLNYANSKTQPYLTLNIETLRSSERSITVQQWTQRNNLEDSSLHCCSCNKLNSRNKGHYQVWRVLQGPANFDNINTLSITGSLF